MEEEEKKGNQLSKVEKKIRTKLTSYEWRKLREKVKLKEELSSFNREFRKHMSIFITGAFSFVAALAWRDAIQSVLKIVISADRINIQNEWMLKLITALIISFLAIITIIIISRLSKDSDS